LNEDYKAKITPKEGIACPDGCERETDANDACICEDLSDFDIKG